MTDSIKAWIEERRAIHSKGTDVLLRNAYELDREAELWGEDSEAIADAHRNFPRALDAIERVLELHTKSDMVRRMPLQLRKTDEDHLDYHWCEECGYSYPCATVQAIEGAINDG